MFESIFEKLQRIELLSKEFLEQWAYLTFNGIYQSDNKSFFEELYQEFFEKNLQASLIFKIDNDILPIQEFIEDIQVGDKWEIHINKLSLVNIIKKEKNIFVNIFYSKVYLEQWIKHSQPFTEDHPFNQYHRIKIVVKDLDESFGGYNFVISNSLNIDFDENPDIVDENCMLSHVHILSSDKIVINPKCHIMTFGDISPISKYFYRNAILLLLACLCNEIRDADSLVLRGIRRISLHLGQNYEGDFSECFYKKLIDSIQWLYEDKNSCELKLKLFLDRVTLDIDLDSPLIIGIQPIINDSLEQAQERYSYIVYDKSNSYHNELKELLKDIKSITELYTTKIRGLVSNLLRDLLATLILIGITLFSQASDIQKLFENKLISYAFIAFGFYFLISGLLQIGIDFFDTRRSVKEFDYWQNISREYMSKKDFLKHKSESLGNRTKESIIIYLLIWICYILLSIICFNAFYIKEIITKV